LFVVELVFSWVVVLDDLQLSSVSLKKTLNCNQGKKKEGKDFADFCVNFHFQWSFFWSRNGEPRDASKPTHAFQKVADKLPLIGQRHGSSVTYCC